MLQGWVYEVESEVLAHLRTHEGVSLQGLAEVMRISESLALSYVSMLVREGKVTIAGLGLRRN
jgi:predicted ArsR family transcriptional regulator